MQTREELEERLKDWPEEIRKRVINDILKHKERMSLEESCKHMSERQFMLLTELDNTMTIEERLRFYYIHCNPEYARETNGWRYKLMANTMREEEFLEKTKYDTTMTEEEKLDFYHKYHHNKY